MIHNEVRHDLLVSDAKQIAQTVTQQVILPFLQINADPNIDVSRIPYFAFDTKEREDLSQYADALPKLVAIGVQIPEKWTRDKLGIPDAQEGEAVLMPLQTPFNGDLKTTEKPTALSAQGNHHGAGCPCGCRSAALTADPQSSKPQQILDNAITEALQQPDFNRQLDPIAQKAVAVLQTCDSYNEALDKLAAIYPDLTGEAHVQYLSQALFLADLLGAADAERR